MLKKIAEKESHVSYSSPLLLSTTIKQITPRINSQKFHSDTIHNNKKTKFSSSGLSIHRKGNTTPLQPIKQDEEELNGTFQVKRKRRKGSSGSQLVNSDDSDNEIVYEEEDGIASLFSSSSPSDQDEDYNEIADDEFYSSSIKGRNRKKNKIISNKFVH